MALPRQRHDQRPQRPKETVDCGPGKKDVATVDKNDKTQGCEKVKRAKK
jgi:hypothetical protein